MKKQNTQAISIAAMTALLMAASGADVMAQANCSTDQS